jgi:hypothetical protein
MLSSLAIRLNNSDAETPTLATRWLLLRQLAASDAHAFLLPQWSHPQSLLLAAGACGAGVAAAWWQVGRARRVALPLAAVAVAAAGGLIAWWAAAPGHAAPHLHFFPRMLLIPPLALLAGAARVLSPLPPPEPVRWRFRWHHALTILLLIAVQPPLLRWGAARLDERVYPHIWATTDSAPRREDIRGAFLPATSLQAPGPARLKSGWPLLGGVNVWALNLDDTRWQPKDGQPWVYETRFEKRAAVTEILVRFPGPPRPFGQLRSFTIALVGAPTASVLNEWSPGLEVTDVGFLRCLRYRLERPVVATGVRLTVHDANVVPVLYDLLAFGNP